MILGIGTDVAVIDRIAQMLEEQGTRFLIRCFTDGERNYVENRAKEDFAARAAGYAKRWAAKEAVAKALGTGIRDGIFLKDIEVVNDASGRPGIELHGGAKDRLTALTPRGMTEDIWVSLSDDAPMAQAFVIISASPSDSKVVCREG